MNPPVRRAAGAAFLTSLLLLPAVTRANPTAPRVESGAATVATAGHTLTVDQSTSHAIISWEDFSIGSGEVTRFNQPDSQSAVLNRVRGDLPSNLLGSLQANGSVFLLNDRGILVGEDARLDVGAFFATTLDLDDADFLHADDLALHGDSRAAVVNLGRITARNGGIVLVGAQVANRGSLRAPDGTVSLAAAQDVVLSPASGDLDIRYGIDAALAADGIDQSGLIESARADLQAASGNLYTLAINQTGIVRATGTRTVDGRILLTADGGTIGHQGALSAHNVDGSGGEILVGGGVRGADSAIANADRTVVTTDATIDVAAAGGADAGRAVVWADGATRFHGTIDASAGSAGGDGGWVEVSGHDWLEFNGAVDLSAPTGTRGSLLLDPVALTVQDNSGTNTDLTGSGDPFTFAPTSEVNASVLDVGRLETQLASGNVVLETSTSHIGITDASIAIDAPVAWASGNNLTLKAGTVINVNASISAGTGDLTLLAGAEPFGIDPTSIQSTADATLQAGRLILGVNPDANPAGSNPDPSGNSLRGVELAGPVTVDTLQLQIPSAGVHASSSGNALNLTNAGNAIGTFRSTGGTGGFRGDISLFTTGDLTVSASLLDVDGEINVFSAGDFTLDASATLRADNQDLHVGSTGGTFHNQSGSDALAVTDNGASPRILVYSDTVADTALDGLDLSPVYHTDYAGTAPAAVTATGDRILYSEEVVLTVNAADFTITYGQAVPALDIAVSGLRGTDTINDALTGTADLGTTATGNPDAGTYPITFAPGSLAATDTNYTINLGTNGTLTVAPSALTVTANDATRRAGQPNPTFTAAFTGLVNGDLASDYDGRLTLTTTADLSSDPGDYAIVPGGISDPNYAITFAPGTLTLTDRAGLLIDVLDASKSYGQPNPAFDANITGFEGGDDESIITGLTFAVAADATTGVGSYVITASGADAGPTYDISYLPGTLTINPALLTISADNTTRTYGAANPAFTASFTGLVAGDDAGDFPNLAFTTPATDASGVGDYAITPAGVTNPNYDVSYVPGTLTVDPAPLTFTLDDHSVLYRDATPGFTWSLSGLVLGEDESVVGNAGITTTHTATSDVGSYAITASPTSANYDITVVPGTITVNPRPLTITVDDQATTFGDPVPTFTASYPDSALNAGYSDANWSFDSPGLPAGNPGTHAITLSGYENSNYDVTVLDGTWTVTSLGITLTADSFTRLYGDPNPSLTYQITGLPNHVALGDVVTGVTLGTTADASSAVGTYAITLAGTAVPGSGYDLTFVPGTLTVDPRPLNIAVLPTYRTYGDAPDGSYNFEVQGLVNGDTADIVNLSWGDGSTARTPAGTWPLYLNFATAPNYRTNIEDLGGFVETQLVIRPRPLTITADDVSREYGDPNPAFTATFDGLASFDSPAVIANLGFTTLATPASPVQNLGITPTADANPNYAITFLPGTLAIVPAPLTVGFGELTRTYGRANPDFTPVIDPTQLKGSDTLASIGLTISTPATAASPVGDYAITAALPDGNYALDLTPGTLRIDPAPLEVSITNESRKFGEPNATGHNVRVTGLVLGDTADDIITVSNPFTVEASAGTYALDVAVLNANYTISALSGGQFTVLPRNLILKPANVARFYGDADPGITVLVGGDGLASFHTIDDLVEQITSAEPYDTGAAVGSRQVWLQLFDTPDYVVDNRPGLYVILPRPTTLTVEDLVVMADDTTTRFVATADNLAPFDFIGSAFPNLGFDVLPVDARAPVGQVNDPASWTFPDAYSDNLDGELPAAPEADDTLGDITITFTDNEFTGQLLPFIDSVTGLINPAFDQSVDSSEVLGDETYYVQPTGYRYGNYVVTRVNNGELTYRYPADFVESWEEAERESARQEEIAAARQAFETPTRGQFAFGLPATIGATVIQNVLGHAVLQNEDIAVAILGESKSDGELTPEDYEALTLWLSDFNANPEKQTLLMPALADYAMTASYTPYEDLTAGQQAIVDHLLPDMQRTRDAIAQKAAAKYQEWQDAQGSVQLADMISGSKAPFEQFMNEAGAEVTSAKMDASLKLSLSATSGAVGAGVAAGSVAGSMNSLFAKATDAAVKGGVRLASGAMTTANMHSLTSVAGGPATIVSIAVSIGVNEAIRVSEQAAAEAKFNELIDSIGQPIEAADVSGDPLFRQCFTSALSEMITAPPPDPNTFNVPTPTL